MKFIFVCSLQLLLQIKQADIEIMNNSDKIKAELLMIDALLQDIAFAETMAHEIDAASYNEIGKTPPPFLLPDEANNIIATSVADEKVAINLAGLYALEAGINCFCQKNDSSIMDWLERIIQKEMPADEMELLNRFANATWKAGQPFRELKRIQRYNFTGFSSLSDEEVQKDYRQIEAAAAKLKSVLQAGTKYDQFKQLQDLLHDKAFAFELAAFMESSYYIGENKPVPVFISNEETVMVRKRRFKEEKIAISLAAFYGLECAVNYLVMKRKQPATFILRSIIDGSISAEDKLLIVRFANAAWKAGQPFCNLDCITLGTFKLFNLLSEAAINNYWVQVKAAAALLYYKLTNEGCVP